MPLKTDDQKSRRARRKVEEEERRALARIAREEREDERARAATSKKMTMTTRAALSGRDLPSRPHMYEERRKRRDPLGASTRRYVKDAADETTYAKIAREVDGPARTRGPAPVPFIQPGAPRPGGPADFGPFYDAARYEYGKRPLEQFGRTGPAEFDTANPIKLFMDDAWRAYVEAGYKRSTAVDYALGELDNYMKTHPRGQTFKELQVAQGVYKMKDADVLRDDFLNVVIGPWLASRLPGGYETKKDLTGWDYVDLAGLFPAAKAARLLGAGSKAVGLTRFVDDLIGVRRVGNTPVRALRMGDATIDTLAAKSLPGRVAETVAEKARPYTSIVPGVMTPEQKFGRDVARSLTTRAQVRGASGSRLAQIGGALGPDEGAAIRFILDHGKGGADELSRRVAFHADAAREATGRTIAFKATGKGKEARVAAREAVRHATVSGAFENARKYLRHTDEGWRIADDAPERLRRTFDIYQKAGGGREDLLKKLGLGDDGMFAARVDMPGQVVRGEPIARPGPAGQLDLLAGDSTKVGTGYAPYTRSTFPIKATRHPKTWVAAVRNFNAGRGKRALVGPKDDTLINPFTGAAMRSSTFEINPSGAMADQVVKAVRLDVANELRTIAEQVGSDLPRTVDDIAVVVDKQAAGSRIPQAMKDLWEAMDNVAENGKIDVGNLDRIDPSEIERFRRTLFPETIADRPIAEIAQGKLDEIERAVSESLDPLRTVDPIPGIKWVNPAFAQGAGITGQITPQINRLNLENWRRYWNAGRKGRAAGAVAGTGFDVINDISKLQALYLNPAYGPVQLLGNGGMMLIQQGAFAPVNMKHAFRLHEKIGDEAIGILDNLVGEGFYKASTRFEALSPMRVMGRVYSRAIDVGPRRTAFLHEARRMGYKNPEQLRSLLLASKTNDVALSKVNLIKEGALRALVDFNRLNPFERNYVTRVVWFYPWLKGAAHWTKRFPLDHPYQAAMFGYLENERRKNRPEGPSYTRFLAKIPGTDLVMASQQLLTPYSAIETAENVVGTFTGTPGVGLIEQFTPALDAILKGTMGGVDEITGAPVKRGAGTFVDEFTHQFKGPRPYLPLSRGARQRIDNLLQSPEEREKRNKETLYPTEWWQDALGMVLGPTGPRGYNEKIGRERKRRQEGGKKTTEEKVDDKVAKLQEETGGKKVPAWAVDLIEKRERINDNADMIRERMKEEYGRDDLTDHETDYARLEATLDELYGPESERTESYLARARKSARFTTKALYKMSDRLGFDRLSKWEGRNKPRTSSVVEPVG